MKANLGKSDRIIRAALGIILFFAPLMNMPAIWSSPAFAYASMGIGVVLFSTSFFKFCPMYKILGVSTR